MLTGGLMNLKYTIFYSWQSDLPNRENRSFIENCIKKAIKQNENSMDMNVYFDYDRDTKGTCGSPDIAEVIFDKIEKSDVFICDISIINSISDCRKTPNPNVLLELGFASKTLGWEKVICLFNQKYGDVKDLPFDLSHKRTFFYNSDDEYAKEKVSIGLAEALKLIYSKGLLFNPLKDYMKGKIDYCWFLRI